MPSEGPTPKHQELTAEQQALSLRRQQLREAQPKKEGNSIRERLLLREWLSTPVPRVHEIHYSFKIMTWNILAQTLVRRDLFPTSDCLKGSQRDPMIAREILNSSADVICLQEVDRLDKLLPVVSEAGYAHTYAAGSNKKHGCMILYKNELFAKVQEKTISYDEECVRVSKTDVNAHGSSFLTRNIGLLVALQHKTSSYGCIVATTHLFWHPKYAYERARQTVILIREIKRFQTGILKQHWPCFIAGDFNCAPDDSAYSLLTTGGILPSQIESIEQSRVVHATRDASLNSENPADSNVQDGADPDRVIVNARPCRSEDGLLTVSELEGIHRSANVLRSAYAEAYRDLSIDDPFLFGSRSQLARNAPGFFEPIWTSYTHYWKATLDYIFLMDPPSLCSRVSGVLKSTTAASLEPGLPRKGVCASDHIPLVAELAIGSTD